MQGCHYNLPEGGGDVEERTARLESAVEQLQQTVASLQQRLSALEGLNTIASAATAAATVPAVDAPAAAAPPRRIKDQYDPITVLSLVGRLLLVLAGGFFLRAVTESGSLPAAVGVASAYAYATVWLLMAYRAGSRGLEPNAIMHALGAVMVAYPLTLEASTRFKVLDGITSAPVVALLTAALLIIAWRQRLRFVAWIAILAAIPVSTILLIQSGILIPHAVVLIGMAVLTLWVTLSTGWWGMRWPAAIAADAAVAAVTVRAFAPEQRDAPETAVALQLLLLAGFLGTTAYRTLVRGRNVTIFEMAQSAAVLAVTFGGAIFTAQVLGAAPAAVGASALVIGAVCYAAAFLVVDRNGGSTVNFYFYTTLGLAMVLAGFSLMGAGAAAGGVFAVIGVVAVYLWSRNARLFTLLQGAAYLLAAGIAAGTLAYGLLAMVASPEGTWPRPDAVMIVVLAAGLIAAWLASGRPTAKGEEVAIGGKFLIIILGVWTVGACVIGFLAPVAGGQADGSVDAGVLATVRTGVLSLATLGIAWMSRQNRFREWGWLVYPLLVGIGLKLLTQDFKHSKPATLFIALALYGAALIVAPRLRRRTDKAEPAAPA